MTTPPSTSSLDPVPVTDIKTMEPAILKMMGAGMDVQAVSSLLNIPVSEIRVLTRMKLSSKLTFSQEDQELVEAVRGLVWQAVNKATMYLQYGTPTQKFQMTKLLVGGATKMLGKESTNDFEESRESLTRIMEDMRTIDT